MTSLSRLGNNVKSPPAATAIPICTTKALLAPKATAIGRARELMMIVATIVLSGISRTKIRAKMPARAPALTGTLELSAHGARKG